jgi:hypothetical protein
MLTVVEPPPLSVVVIVTCTRASPCTGSNVQLWTLENSISSW